MQDPTDATVDQLILDRLDAADLGERSVDLVLGALIGGDAFATALGGGTVARPATTAGAAGGEPVGTYLDRIEVAGFRGIGPTATLALQPGPGLTIVTGRNGSGKSSFAEAAELAFTGSNMRWAQRSTIWRDSWRNLHATEEPHIRVHLGMEGHYNGATIECAWPAGGKVEDAHLTFQIHGQPRRELAELGWGRPLDIYRPFLSYAELGGLLSGKPSEMYDSLDRILGLDRVVVIEKLLTEARKQADDARKVAAAAQPGVLALVADHPDPRARAAEAELRNRVPDLDALDALTVAEADGDGTDVVQLRQIEAVDLPPTSTITDIVTNLWAAQDTVAALAGTEAGHDRSVAGLLTEALAHAADHPGEPCPVCGGRVLDVAWAAQARAEVERLTRRTSELDAAHEAIRAARRALRVGVPAAPVALATDLGLPAQPARDAWQVWTAAADGPVNRIVAAYEALVAAVEPVRAAARGALAARAQAWQPVADTLRTWIASARESRQAAETHAALQAAITWFRGVAAEIRNDQLAPVVKEATEVWNALRQQSNVSLESITLAGAGPQRHLDLDVTVDGIPSAALGVMSQGELHSLALALFLPRATMAASPFRFIVIDDPVQSMDPAKVAGLATVLAMVAKTRQVIVFTHDDRLPAAVRQLQLKDARIVAVDRQASSAVAVTTYPGGNPARRYISSAGAVAQDERIDPSLRGVLVAGLIRDALESACHDAVRRRDHHLGKPVTETEHRLEQAHTLRDVIALAMGETGHAEKEMLAKLHPAAYAVVTAANKGAHGNAVTGLGDLITSARRVVGAIDALWSAAS